MSIDAGESGKRAEKEAEAPPYDPLLGAQFEHAMKSMLRNFKDLVPAPKKLLRLEVVCTPEEACDIAQYIGALRRGK